MSLHSICFSISQSKRLEYYRIGLRSEIYPHGYILSELIKVAEPLPYNYIYDSTKIENISDVNESELDPLFEKAKINANAFLEKFYNPDIFRVPFYDDTTYEHETKLVPEYEKAKCIVEEALILRKLIQNVISNNIQGSKPYRSIGNAISSICEFDEIAHLLKTRITDISIVPELVPVEKKLSVIKKKETYEIHIADNEEGEAIDKTEWQVKQKALVLDIDFRYIVKNFIAIPWLELLYTLKNNYIIYKCPACNNYYFHYLKKRKCCEVCGYPSTKQTDEKRAKDRYKKRIERGMPEIQAKKLLIEDLEQIKSKEG